MSRDTARRLLGTDDYVGASRHFLKAKEALTFIMLCESYSIGVSKDERVLIRSNCRGRVGFGRPSDYKRYKLLLLRLLRALEHKREEAAHAG